MLEIGSLNLYMFHGEQILVFIMGVLLEAIQYLPQMPSYDYDALLNEAGQPTKKYYAVQRVIKKFVHLFGKQSPEQNVKNLGTYPVNKSVSLFHKKELDL